MPPLPLHTATAAAICGISPSHLKRLAQAIGIRPGRAPIGRLARGYRLLWGARHLLSLLVLAPLARLGVTPTSAAVFARGLSEQPSDEVLEAVLRDRPYTLILSPSVIPHAVDSGTIQKAIAHHGSRLRAQGQELVALDLRPLLTDLHARIPTTEVVGNGTR